MPTTPFARPLPSARSSGDHPSTAGIGGVPVSGSVIQKELDLLRTHVFASDGDQHGMREFGGLPPSPHREGTMSYARQMLETYPRGLNVDPGVLAATIDALNDCTQACAADADADLSEPNVAELVKCVRLCLECTDVCGATVGVVSRQAEYDANVAKPLLEACVASCKSCGDECEQHARMHEHCRVCAEACRRCERACRELLAAMKVPAAMK